jgi:hypothetical protein
MNKIDWFPIGCAAVIALIFLLFIFAADSEKLHSTNIKELNQQYYDVIKTAMDKGWTPEQIRAILITTEHNHFKCKHE